MKNVNILKPDTLKKDLYLFKKYDKWIAFGKISGLIIILEEIEAHIINDYLNNISLNDICDKNNIDYDKCFDIIKSISDYIKKSQAIISEASNIEAFLILVAESCNLGCSYCYGKYHSHDVSQKLMNFDTLKRIMIVADRMKVKGIGFFGGEPLLNFKVIKDSVEFADSQGYNFEYGITTNGTLINEEIASFLQKFNFKASVGLDGDDYNHNLTRIYKNGRQSYEDVLRGLKLLANKKILDAIEVTYSMKHSSSLKDIINSVRPYCKTISCTCVDGKKGVPWENEIIDGDRLVQYYSDMLEILIENSESDDPLYLGGSIELVSNLLSPIKVLRSYICSGVMSRATITTNGNMYPCPETLDKQFCFGNIHDENISNEIEIKRKTVLDLLRKDNVQDYWFSNIVDACIVRLSKDEKNGKLRLENTDVVSECFENIIYKLTQIDSNKLMKNLYSGLC